MKMKKFVLILGLFLSFSANVWADAFQSEQWYKKLDNCAVPEENSDKKCSEEWSMECYNHRMKIQKNIQQCYKELAVELFENFFGLPETKAIEQFDTYSKFIYNQYFFIYGETNYCKKNNCGVSPYLYSEYATTQQLNDYITKIITYMTNQ